LDKLDEVDKYSQNRKILKLSLKFKKRQNLTEIIIE